MMKFTQKQADHIARRVTQLYIAHDPEETLGAWIVRLYYQNDVLGRDFLVNTFTQLEAAGDARLYLTGMLIDGHFNAEPLLKGLEGCIIAGKMFSMDPDSRG